MEMDWQYQLIGIEERAIEATPVPGLTDLYAVRLGLDAFHGATVTGNKIIRTYLPDFKQPGAVKTGEVEMIAAVVLKSKQGLQEFLEILRWCNNGKNIYT